MTRPHPPHGMSGREGSGGVGEVGEKPGKLMMEAREIALLCAREVLEVKAQELTVLDVRGLCSFADYFLICQGKSTRQVQGMADRLEESLRSRGIRPLGVEGRPENHWILMDYGDVIVHIFHEPTRRFYDLESLWADAPRVVTGDA
jgi:ribosome-associated protein